MAFDASLFTIRYSSPCAMCRANQDSWRHSLLECNMDQSVWALLDDEVVEHISSNIYPNPKEWLFFLIETLPHDDLTRVMISLWAIWTARRKAIHEEIFQSPLSTFHFINSYLRDLEIVNVGRQRSTSIISSPSANHAKWIAPPPNFAKVNVDAVVSKTKACGTVGTVCRDVNGNLLGASALVINGSNTGSNGHLGGFCASNRSLFTTSLCCF